MNKNKIKRRDFMLFGGTLLMGMSLVNIIGPFASFLDQNTKTLSRSTMRFINVSSIIPGQKSLRIPYKDSFVGANDKSYLYAIL